jgi:hypothetical protein
MDLSLAIAMHRYASRIPTRSNGETGMAMHGGPDPKLLATANSRQMDQRIHKYAPFLHEVSIHSRDVW